MSTTNTQMLDEFLRSYLEKAQSYDLEPHPRVIQALSECRKEFQHRQRSLEESASNQYNSLIINGNVVGHFNNRIQDIDVFPLAEILEKYQMMIHALDLRYHKLSNSSMEALNKVLASTELYYLNLKGNNIKSVKKLLGLTSRQNQEEEEANSEGEANNTITGTTNWSNFKLKCLDLSENPIEDIMLLAESLHENQTIASLNVSSVDSLKTNEFIRFAIQLREHPLKIFRASRPPMVKLPHEVIVHFSDMLRLNHSLRILELSRCALTCHDLQLLIQHGILLNKRKSAIRVLDLSGNHIGCDGALWISRWLQDSSSELQQLNLSHNRIGLVGGSHLADALSRNQVLKSLDLSHNPLGDNALYELAMTLSESNTTLQSLRLKGCKFDQRSMQSFYDLQHHIRPMEGEHAGSTPPLVLDLVAYKSPNTAGKDVYYMADQNQAPTTEAPRFLAGTGTHAVLDSPYVLELLNEYEMFDENENQYLDQLQRQQQQEEDHGSYEEYEEHHQPRGYVEEVGEDYQDEESDYHRRQEELYNQYGNEMAGEEDY